MVFKNYKYRQNLPTTLKVSANLFSDGPCAVYAEIYYHHSSDQLQASKTRLKCSSLSDQEQIDQLKHSIKYQIGQFIVTFLRYPYSVLKPNLVNIRLGHLFFESRLPHCLGQLQDQVFHGSLLLLLTVASLLIYSIHPAQCCSSDLR